MDIETEKIIELLFPDGVPDSWKENPEFYQYLTKIGGYDVTALNKEPDLLSEEKKSIEQQTQDLIFSNYKTFIETAENSREIHKEFNKIEVVLNQLCEQGPTFVDECKSFCNVSQDINSYRKLNTLTLSKTPEILEILELPQLMENCLKQRQYNEALELSHYARYLSTKHGDIAIISNVVNQIENSWSQMVNQVIHSLKDDLPLPKCLQLTGLLRSMDAFTESELRIKFLHARDSWFQGLLDSIPKDDPNIHLTKTIELSRIHLFNIITQYRAIFNDDDHFSLGKDALINDAAIFYQWLEEKVCQFLLTLSIDLPRINSIDSLLGQCTYFGLSFGRVGADFSGRMSDIFIQVIRNKFEVNISKTIKNFEKNMENFILINKLLKLNIKFEVIVNSENPPESLVEYYPLAEYCNGLIEAFNELRLHTPIALANFITNLLKNSLHSVAKIIFNYYKKREGKLSENDKQNMARFAECFSEQLVPYVQFCLHSLFPPNQITLHLGISVNQLQKEGILYLDQQIIFEPIKSLLPVKNIPLDILTPEPLEIRKSDGINLAEKLNDISVFDNENHLHPEEKQKQDVCLENLESQDALLKGKDTE